MDLMVSKQNWQGKIPKKKKKWYSGVTEKKLAKFSWSAKKGHVWKESGVTTQGRREVEVGTLLLGNDKDNVIAGKLLSYF